MAVRAATVLTGGLLALAVAGCSTAPQQVRRSVPLRANPSAVIAAELALARAAQESGQWTAFAQAAADGAVMLAPEPVDAKAWLKGHANPAQALHWQPHSVWSSCDGSIAVTRGAWQRPDMSTGYFVAVWQRQADDSFKWLLKADEALPQPLARPDLTSAVVADCGKAEHPAAAPHESAAYVKQGEANDGTLTWHFATAPGQPVALAVDLWRAGQMQRIQIAPLAEGTR